jgi:hypothetical protein
VLKEVNGGKHFLEEGDQVVKVLMLKCHKYRLGEVNLPIVTIRENVFVPIIDAIAAGGVTSLHEAIAARYARAARKARRLKYPT